MAPPKPLARRIAKKVLVAVACCTLVPVALLYVFQDRFVYVTDAPVLPLARVLPDAREVVYRASDGTALTGWFLPSRRPAPGCGAAPSVLLFHGQGGNRSWEHPIAAALASRGANVFLAEYRGFGGTEGDPSERGIALDARAALAALDGQPEVDATRVVYVGYSLGTGVATTLAVDQVPSGLVLLAPYTSLPDLAWERLPGIPYHLLMHEQYDTLSRIGAVDAPLFVAVGTDDEVVPTEQSARVFAAARRPEAMVTLAGVHHGDLEAAVVERALDRLVAFVWAHAGCPTG